jgi:hypothetical protein
MCFSLGLCKEKDVQGGHIEENISKTIAEMFTECSGRGIRGILRTHRLKLNRMSKWKSLEKLCMDSTHRCTLSF